MSGGHFDYGQWRISDIADEVERLIAHNDSRELDENGCRRGRGYSPAVIEEFQAGLRVLRQAAVYAQRIDWLVSGDDGEESFLRRLAAELKPLREEA